MLLSTLLLACTSAAHTGHGHWAGAFSVDAPPRWQVTRNRRVMGHHLWVVQAPDGCCDIAIERRRENRDTRELPLSLLSDTLPLQAGRVHGIVAEPVGHHQLALRGREAWATTVQRHNGPRTWMETTVFTRAPDGLYVLTLRYVEGAGPQVARAWERVLTSFDLPAWPVPDTPPWDPEPFLDDPPSAPLSEGT